MFILLQKTMKSHLKSVQIETFKITVKMNMNLLLTGQKEVEKGKAEE